MEHNILCGKILHKIEYKLLMKAAIIRTGMKNMTAINKHYLAGFGRHYGYGNGIYLGASEGFAKNLSRFYTGNNISVSKIMIPIEWGPGPVSPAEGFRGRIPLMTGGSYEN